MKTNDVYEGDCLDVMRQFPDNCIDTIITDPPYSLSSIKRRFAKTSIDDNLTGQAAKNGTHQYGRLSAGFMGKEWDNEIAFNPVVWREALRVAKPGATLMAFGGTRTYHRLVCAIEDAGWEIRDCIMWIYGTGFPKSLDIGKAIDKRAIVDCPECNGTGWILPMGEDYVRQIAQVEEIPIETAIIAYQVRCGHCEGSGKVKGAEREIVGEIVRLGDKKPYAFNLSNHFGKESGQMKPPTITAPATPLAQQWDGWGTALKPAFEPLIWACKPLNYVPNYDIITETNILLGAMLCLLLSSVNDAEKILRLSPVEQSEGSVFVAVLVNLLNGERSGELSAKMAMFNSPEMVSTCLNIARLWNNILGEILNEANKFTTKMETEVTTALKILNSLIFPIIPDYIIQAVYQVDGLQSDASNVTKNSRDANPNTKDIPKHFVTEIATWKTSESGTDANIAAKSLQLLIPSVNSVLTNAIPIPEEKNNDITPAYEPIVVAMKPVDQNYAHNAEKWGVAGLNIDGGRIGTEQTITRRNGDSGGKSAFGCDKRIFEKLNPPGRWPANIIHDSSPEVEAEFAKAGVRKTSGQDTKGRVMNSEIFGIRMDGDHYGDTGTPSRFFQICLPDDPPLPKGRWPANVIHDSSPEVEAEFAKAGVRTSGARQSHHKFGGIFGNGKNNSPPCNGDTGSASRYFYTCPPDPTQHPEAARFHYCSKASSKERGSNNNHPTVKPLSLLRYLAKLTKTPIGGIVLDPFAGSGTTALAAIAEWRDYILIEKEAEYAEICKRRIAEYTGQEIEAKEIELAENESVKQLALW